METSTNLSIRSPNFVTLFLNLPRDIQGTILHDLSFLDIANLCSVIGSDICYSDQYFQLRLVDKSVNPNIIQRYRDLIQNQVQPQVAYIKALIDGKQINLDPSILIWISESDILFPGIEYFIGLNKMGQRAIDLNRSDYILYVLQSYPNEHETTQIIGSLYMKYMDWVTKRDTSSFPLLNQDLLNDLFNTESPRFADFGQRYYPRDARAYHVYKTGLSGSPLGTRSEYPDWKVPYIYGLIDGGQDQVFINLISRLNLTFRQRWGMESDDWLLTYVANWGTARMAEAVINKMRNMPVQGENHDSDLTQMFHDAVKGDNQDVVDFILLHYRDIIDVAFENLTPNSIEMDDLLERHGVYASDENTLLGIIGSGNYRFLLYLFGEYWYDLMVNIPEGHDLFSAFSHGPAYLMSAYLTKFKESYLWKEPSLHHGLGIFMVGYLVTNHDLYREEVLLNLGFEPDDGTKEMMTQQMEDLILGPIFGVNLGRYPNLKRYLNI